jgi:PAS domain S-box-containing protein
MRTRVETEDLRSRLRAVEKEVESSAREMVTIKRDKDALKESEARYRALFEHMLNGFAYCRMIYEDGRPKDFVYLAVNPAFEKLTGLKDVIGKKVSEVIPHLREAEELLELYGRVALTGVSEQFEIYIETLGMWFAISVYSPASEEFVAVFDVITERKQAENALRESEWKFRAIFNQNFQLMGLLTLDGTVIEANTTALSLSGVDESEVKGKHFWDTPWWAHSKDLQNQLREAINNCAKGECIALEVTHPAANGDLRYLDFSIRPLKDDAGKVIFLIPEARDISDRKRAEKALSEAAAKYRIVADNTYNWEVWLSPEGRYIYSSPSCRRITGHAAEDFVTSPELLDTLVHADDVDAWSRHRQQALTTRSLKEIEFRLLRDGATVWIHHVCTPIYDESGVFRGTRGNFEDITNRKQAEEKNLLLATVVESSDDAIFAKTADGIVTSWNRGAEKIFGYREAEVLGKSVAMLFPSECTEEVLRLHEKVRRGEHIEHYETVSRKKDGELIDMSFTYSPIKDEHGKVVAISCTGRDITARNKAAAALKENERIKRELELHEKELLLLRQSRLAAMGEMIGNIAHQWRQPLNTLGLCAQELCMTFRKGEFSYDYLESCVDKMMQTIRYMSKTIDDFRDFTRPEKEKVDFSVREVIDKTVSLQQDTLNAEKIKIEVVGACDPLVTGYPNEFSQVLLNIMMNARDAFLKQTVQNPVIKIELGTEGGRCLVTITDNAGGIPEEIIDKIFDPYFTTKGPEQGTGIGLYMSKTVIEKKIGGSLTARNVAGGAQFRIVV